MNLSRQLLVPILFLGSLLVAPSGRAQTGGETMRTMPCRASQVQLQFDGENGAFAGMQQNGTRVFVRNGSGQVCSVLPQPVLTFRDKAGKPVALEQAHRRFMHPGPVQIPVVLRPGEQATGVMHWVANPVFGGAGANTCAQVSLAHMQVGEGGVDAPLTIRVCGPGGSVPTYDLAEQLHVGPKGKPGEL